MDDLVDRLRVSAEPVGHLLLEAAAALQAARARIAELTETLNELVEIGNSQRSREFADVKRTLTKARALLSGSSAVPQPAASAVQAPVPAHPASAEIVSLPQSEATKPRDEELVSGMYKEIQNLLRYSA